MMWYRKPTTSYWGILTLLLSITVWVTQNPWLSAATIFSAVVLAYKVVADIVIWRKQIYHAFELHLFDQERKEYLSEIMLPMGLHIIIARVYPLNAVELNNINVRFVNRQQIKGWWILSKTVWSDIDKGIINVTNLSDDSLHRLEKSRYGFSSISDDYGGFDGEYNPPLPRAHEEFIELKIEFLAGKESSSYLSFRGIIGGHRRYARRRIVIKGG